MLELDPFFTTLVTTLAARAGHGVADAAHGAWSRLVRLVRRKLAEDPAAVDALEAVERAPDDPDCRAALIATLRQKAIEDAQFGQQLHSLWQQAQVEIHAEHGGVASQFAGSGQQVFQAGQQVTVNYHRSPEHPRPVPHQVPAATATFVNRTAELSGVDKVAARSDAASGGTAVCLLVGMPGIGKTTTACRWNRLNQGRFAGGELYVDFAPLHNRTGRGADVSEAVASCLRGMGVQEPFIPAGLTDQISLYRTLSAERPMLIMMDGVNEPAQVRSLMPTAPGSVVLVATEHALGELVQDGAHLIRIDPLDEPAAVSLLSSICGATRIGKEPDAASAVARLCGGHPDALRVAAARMVLDPTLTVSALAGELAGEARRLEALSLPAWGSTGTDGTVATVTAAFAASYADLPAPAQRLYRDLGVMPMYAFSGELVRWVSGAAAVQTALPRLVAASLVQRVAEGHYLLHNLVKLHAARQAAIEPDHRDEEVIARVVDFYTIHAGWADRAVMGDRLRIADPDPAASGVADPFDVPDRRPAGLAWLEGERTNLLRVLRAAVDAELDEPACQLAEALTALYFNHRHHTEWIESTELGIQAAQRLGRDDVEARLRSMVSRAWSDLGQPHRARVEIELAMPAATKVDNLRLLASVWEFRGRVLDFVDVAAAIEAYQRSIELNTRERERRGAALATYFLGRCLDRAGRTTEALPLLQQARKELRELGDDRMGARCTYSIGLAHLHLGAYAEAEDELVAAVERLAAAGLWHYEVEAREALAELAMQTDRRETAREHLTRALQIEKTVGGTGLTRIRAALARLG